jgi:phenylpropionate dioxygenase-like ring-hydroxylating dioxygenase large terminal subunit
MSLHVDFQPLPRWIDKGPAGSSTMPAHYYTSELIYQLERNHLFTQTWHLVGKSDDVAQPGDYFTTDLFGEPLLVVCGRDGVARAMINVCRHRASMVALGAGNKKAFSCPFHGWVYDLDGQLKRCAGMDGAADFNPSGIGLPPLRTETWGRWVFVALGDDTPPFEEWISTTAARAANYNLEGLVFRGGRHWNVDANWKAYNDANHEAYHVPFLHPSLFNTYPKNQFGVTNASKNWDGSAVTADNGSYTKMTTSFGGEICLPEVEHENVGSRPVALLGSVPEVREIAEPMPQLQPADHVRHYFTFMWPGLVQFHFMPDGVVVLQMRPESVNRTVVTMEFWLPPAASLEQELIQASLIVYGVQILDEDVAMISLTDRGMRSRHYNSGRFAPTPENLLYEYNVWYGKQMEPAFESAGIV